MKVLATSDLHGNLPNITEEFDLLLICGDICPAHDHYFSYQIEWVKNEFCEWINSLNFKNSWSKVVMTWGNHDFVGERITKADITEISLKTGGHLVILNHEMYDFEYPVSDGIDSLRIFGTPYCGMFGRWAFMYPDDTLDKKFSQIPDDVDVLISHDSPNFNMLGSITEGKWKNDDTGNRVIYNHVKRVKPLIYHCGHFHSGNHKFENIDGTWMANVSYINEAYYPAYPVLSYEIDTETKKVIYNE